MSLLYKLSYPTFGHLALGVPALSVHLLLLFCIFVALCLSYFPARLGVEGGDVVVLMVTPRRAESASATEG